MEEDVCRRGGVKHGGFRHTSLTAENMKNLFDHDEFGENTNKVSTEQSSQSKGKSSSGAHRAEIGEACPCQIMPLSGEGRDFLPRSWRILPSRTRGAGHLDRQLTGDGNFICLQED